MEEGLHCRGSSLLSGGVSDDDEQVAVGKGIDDEGGKRRASKYNVPVPRALTFI